MLKLYGPPEKYTPVNEKELNDCLLSLRDDDTGRALTVTSTDDVSRCVRTCNILHTIYTSDKTPKSIFTAFCSMGYTNTEYLKYMISEKTGRFDQLDTNTVSNAMGFKNIEEFTVVSCNENIIKLWLNETCDTILIRDDFTLGIYYHKARESCYLYRELIDKNKIMLAHYSDISNLADYLTKVFKNQEFTLISVQVTA